MSKKLEKGSSLFNAIKKLKHQDCANFLNYLDDHGVELLCRILHYVSMANCPYMAKCGHDFKKK